MFHIEKEFDEHVGYEKVWGTDLFLRTCEENPSVTSGLLSGRASDAEKVSMPWYLHVGRKEVYLQ